jgi:hypothetical protein
MYYLSIHDTLLTRYYRTHSDIPVGIEPELYEKRQALEDDVYLRLATLHGVGHVNSCPV